MQQGLFTSEAVSRGHPDKVCDQISDAVLDAALACDLQARVAVEAMVKDQHVILGGELTLKQGREALDYERIARAVIADIGYVEELQVGFDAAHCRITQHLGGQSADIAGGVDPDPASAKELGAGDQGIIFGYACDETEHFMPAPIHYAHALMRRHEQVRTGAGAEVLRPDAKSQVTFRYDAQGHPAEVAAVVLSTQHSAQVRGAALEELVRQEIIDPVIPAEMRAAEFRAHINPAGDFVTGGPVGDCGLTGRKIIVDTYGGMARHGGGAFSGKDPSKVDRSAAYAARYVARHVVACGLARRCEVQLAYAIGRAEPVSVRVETFGSGRVPDARLQGVLEAGGVFDLSPSGIIGMLGLLDADAARRPCYQHTAEHGHFGCPDRSFPWETANRAQALLEALGE